MEMTETKLLYACHRRDVGEVLRLLSQVRNPADVRDWDKALLHYSCRHGWLDVTRKLVEQYHCDPESRGGWNGDTPLHVACRAGHVDIVRYTLLVNRGAVQLVRTRMVILHCMRLVVGVMWTV